jgi:hypothetical protein
MIRSAAKRAMLLAAAALIASAAVASCSKSKDNGVAAENTGAVDLALTLAPGIIVNSVSYEITGGGITPITGSVNVSDPGATISLLISGIPAGTGYLIKLSATSTTGAVTCAGEAPFAIVANSTTAVTVGLQCSGAGTTGSVSVTAGVNNCPVIGAFTVSPISIGVGGTISLASTASDADGSALTYAWTSSGAGTFGSPTSANTTFVCSPAGSQTLTLTVTDGSCPKTKTVIVSCVGAGGGTGGVSGTGGAPAGTGGAPAGTGGAPAGTGGAPAGTGGAPAGTGGAPAGTGGAPAGTGGAPAGTGGMPAGTGGMPGTGGSTPPVDSTACDACVAANCADDGPGCSSLTGAKAALCDTLFACVRRTNCGAVSNSVCWCGTASVPVCSSTAGAANGPCLAEEVAAAESTDLALISARYTRPDFASGAVHNRIACEKDLCAAVCPPR